MPGWVSASIHKSIDGKQVVNYAQCDSYETWQRVVESLKAGGFFERNQLLGTAHPALYEVVFALDK